MTIQLIAAAMSGAILAFMLVCIWKAGREAREMIIAAAEMCAEAERSGQ